MLCYGGQVAVYNGISSWLGRLQLDDIEAGGIQLLIHFLIKAGEYPSMSCINDLHLTSPFISSADRIPTSRLVTSTPRYPSPTQLLYTLTILDRLLFPRGWISPNLSDWSGM